MWSTNISARNNTQRVLKDSDEEFKFFLTTMEALGEKLGLVDFIRQVDKYGFKSLDDF